MRQGELSDSLERIEKQCIEDLCSEISGCNLNIDATEFNTGPGQTKTVPERTVVGLKERQESEVAEINEDKFFKKNKKKQQKATQDTLGGENFTYSIPRDSRISELREELIGYEESIESFSLAAEGGAAPTIQAVDNLIDVLAKSSNDFSEFEKPEIVRIFGIIRQAQLATTLKLFYRSEYKNHSSPSFGPKHDLGPINDEVVFSEAELTRYFILDKDLISTLLKKFEKKSEKKIKHIQDDVFEFLGEHCKENLTNRQNIYDRIIFEIASIPFMKSVLERKDCLEPASKEEQEIVLKNYNAFLQEVRDFLGKVVGELIEGSNKRDSVEEKKLVVKNGLFRINLPDKNTVFVGQSILKVTGDSRDVEDEITDQVISIIQENAVVNAPKKIKMLTEYLERVIVTETLRAKVFSVLRDNSKSIIIGDSLIEEISSAGKNSWDFLRRVILEKLLGLRRIMRGIEPGLYDRPRSIEFAIMSKLAYAAADDLFKDKALTDLRISIQDWRHRLGWELLLDVDDNVSNNHYRGVAFINRRRKIIVVAHRGTVFQRFLSAHADLSEIVGNKIGGQQAESFDFVRQVIEHITTELGDSASNLFEEYRLGFTGHSLGGWLGGLSLIHFQDLKPMGVFFDPPGPADMAEAIRSNIKTDDSEFTRRDNTVYVSPPDLVNICNKQFPDVVQLCTRDEAILGREKRSKKDLRSLFNSFAPLLVEHSMNNILEQFDVGGSGEALRGMSMSSWPKMRMETLREMANMSGFSIIKKVVKGVQSFGVDTLIDIAKGLYKVYRDQDQRLGSRTLIALSQKRAIDFKQDFDLVFKYKYKPRPLSIGTVPLVRFHPKIRTVLSQAISAYASLKHLGETGVGDNRLGFPGEVNAILTRAQLRAEGSRVFIDFSDIEYQPGEIYLNQSKIANYSSVLATYFGEMMNGRDAALYSKIQKWGSTAGRGEILADLWKKILTGSALADKVFPFAKEQLVQHYRSHLWIRPKAASRPILVADCFQVSTLSQVKYREDEIRRRTTPANQAIIRRSRRKKTEKEVSRFWEGVYRNNDTNNHVLRAQITGGPKDGKTTYLKYFAYLWASGQLFFNEKNDGTPGFDLLMLISCEQLSDSVISLSEAVYESIYRRFDIKYSDFTNQIWPQLNKMSILFLLDDFNKNMNGLLASAIQAQDNSSKPYSYIVSTMPDVILDTSLGISDSNVFAIDGLGYREQEQYIKGMLSHLDVKEERERREHDEETQHLMTRVVEPNLYLTRKPFYLDALCGVFFDPLRRKNFDTKNLSFVYLIQLLIEARIREYLAAAMPDKRRALSGASILDIFADQHNYDICAMFDMHSSAAFETVLSRRRFILGYDLRELRRGRIDLHDIDVLAFLRRKHTERIEDEDVYVFNFDVFRICFSAIKAVKFLQNYWQQNQLLLGPDRQQSGDATADFHIRENFNKLKTEIVDMLARIRILIRNFMPDSEEFYDMESFLIFVSGLLWKNIFEEQDGPGALSELRSGRDRDLVAYSRKLELARNLLSLAILPELYEYQDAPTQIKTRVSQSGFESHVQQRASMDTVFLKMLNENKLLIELMDFANSYDSFTQRRLFESSSKPTSFLHVFSELCLDRPGMSDDEVLNHWENMYNELAAELPDSAQMPLGKNEFIAFLSSERRDIPVNLISILQRITRRSIFIVQPNADMLFTDDVLKFDSKNAIFILRCEDTGDNRQYVRLIVGNKYRAEDVAHSLKQRLESFRRLSIPAAELIELDAVARRVSELEPKSAGVEEIPDPQVENRRDRDLVVSRSRSGSTQTNPLESFLLELNNKTNQVIDNFLRVLLPDQNREKADAVQTVNSYVQALLSSPSLMHVSNWRSHFPSALLARINTQYQELTQPADQNADGITAASQEVTAASVERQESDEASAASQEANTVPQIIEPEEQKRLQLQEFINKIAMSLSVLAQLFNVWEPVLVTEKLMSVVRDLLILLNKVAVGQENDQVLFFARAHAYSILLRRYAQITSPNVFSDRTEDTLRSHLSGFLDWLSQDSLLWREGMGAYSEVEMIQHPASKLKIFFNDRLLIQLKRQYMRLNVFSNDSVESLRSLAIQLKEQRVAESSTNVTVLAKLMLMAVNYISVGAIDGILSSTQRNHMDAPLTQTREDHTDSGAGASDSPVHFVSDQERVSSSAGDSTIPTYTLLNSFITAKRRVAVLFTIAPTDSFDEAYLIYFNSLLRALRHLTERLFSSNARPSQDEITQIKPCLIFMFNELTKDFCDYDPSAFVLAFRKWWKDAKIDIFGMIAETESLGAQKQYSVDSVQLRLMSASTANSSDEEQNKELMQIFSRVLSTVFKPEEVFHFMNGLEDGLLAAAKGLNEYHVKKIVDEQLSLVRILRTQALRSFSGGMKKSADMYLFQTTIRTPGDVQLSDSDPEITRTELTKLDAHFMETLEKENLLDLSSGNDAQKRRRRSAVIQAQYSAIEANTVKHGHVRFYFQVKWLLAVLPKNYKEHMPNYSHYYLTQIYPYFEQLMKFASTLCPVKKGGASNPSEAEFKCYLDGLNDIFAESCWNTNQDMLLYLRDEGELSDTKIETLRESINVLSKAIGNVPKDFAKNNSLAATKNRINIILETGGLFPRREHTRSRLRPGYRRDSQNLLSPAGEHFPDSRDSVGVHDRSSADREPPESRARLRGPAAMTSSEV